MYKLIALFTRPDNVEEFDRHYNEVHAPLMKQVPGLERLVEAKGVKLERRVLPRQLNDVVVTQLDDGHHCDGHCVECDGHRALHTAHQC